MTKTGKIHYGPKDVPGGFRMLPCSGRAVLRAAFTPKGNEVTCRACQRIVNKQVAEALKSVLRGIGGAR